MQIQSPGADAPHPQAAEPATYRQTADAIASSLPGADLKILALCLVGKLAIDLLDAGALVANDSMSTDSLYRTLRVVECASLTGAAIRSGDREALAGAFADLSEAAALEVAA